MIMISTYGVSARWLQNVSDLLCTLLILLSYNAIYFISVFRTSLATRSTRPFPASGYIAVSSCRTAAVRYRGDLNPTPIRLFTRDSRNSPAQRRTLIQFINDSSVTYAFARYLIGQH